MSKLSNLIREHRTGRKDVNDFAVVLIQNFTSEAAPYSRIGNDVLQQASDEPFAALRARTVNALTVHLHSPKVMAH